MLLFASFYFYMNWQPAFALLLAGAGIVTWGGALLSNTYPDNPRLSKFYFITTLILLIGSLFTFKYLNFTADELRDLLFRMDLGMNVPDFMILLPVGISFFTFQALAYVIDVRRGTIKPEKNPLTVLLYLAFFPQLVAGPIERAKDLIPQFKGHHHFNFGNIMAGLEMMMLGYFMKLCVAENVAPIVNHVYEDLNHFSGVDVFIATFLFCFQIFSDFGGYSLIAIGAARCMGFRLTQNFRQPYMATSIRDFWRRWHISLSRWLQDYVYIPLGGNRVKPLRHYFNIFATIFLSGVWHGADYTFLAWGAYHGTLQTAQAAWHKKSRFHLPKNLFTTTLKIIWTFILVMLGRVFFRANSIGDAGKAFQKIFTDYGPLNIKIDLSMLVATLMCSILIMIELRHEWLDINRPSPDGKEISAARSTRSIARSAVFMALLAILLLMFGRFRQAPFIYFQF